MGRRGRSAPDDPDAADKDWGNAAGSDGPLDSALRTERAAAYRAAVDAAYRQHAIDHGNAKVEKPERETVTPATRRIGAEDPERRPAGLVNQLKGRDHPGEATEPENLQVPGRTAAAPQAGPALDEHDAPTWDRASDLYAIPQLASGNVYRNVA